MRALSAYSSPASPYKWIHISNVRCGAWGKERSKSGVGQRHSAPGRSISKHSVTSIEGVGKDCLCHSPDTYMTPRSGEEVVTCHSPEHGHFW